ncbi:sensor histidine kinase [Pontivivens ytuae]|uniref:histidine kinase n=1 Tax=Pontivivens ytuae TaxID=2789856 RepID=A0A7S9LNK0_9RHOB|nr:histidine kinase dimerization/phosphoacceptor domain -containing protein [Pontivivens ytuae]QPH52397.1 hypothetical protein I0K15_11225 [Pontivivens ytuae]
MRNLSLAWQIVLLLSLALLPIGGFAVFEAVRTSGRNETLLAAELLRVANRAAEVERLEIAEGFGSAKALARSAAVASGDRAQCSAELTDFINASTRYVFAGFIEADGFLRCSSVGDVIRDFREDEGFRLQIENPTRTVTVVESGAVSRQAVLIVSHPVIVDGAWRGTLSLSVPRDVVRLFDAVDDSVGELQVALVDDSGQFLARSDYAIEQSWWLPVGLADRATEPETGPYVFRENDTRGTSRLYAYVPIVEGELAGIFSLPNTPGNATGLATVATAIALPVSIWILCIMLAYFAMRRLVVDPVRRINRSILAFKGGNRGFAIRPLPPAPGELGDLGESFTEMARTVNEGERELSNLVEEKTVLLLEVYHRVKNNLQLIISIMNIQLRSTTSERERATILRLRERIMGLALVHQRLYETPSLTAVPADGLVSEIIQNLTEGGDDETGQAAILTELDSFPMNPDQAVPFSLLVTEALLNALKYTCHQKDDARITVQLRLEDGTVHLLVENTIDPDVIDSDSLSSSGIGHRLIGAFVLQLAGRIERERTESLYRLDLRFDHVTPSDAPERIGAPGRQGLRRVS